MKETNTDDQGQQEEEETEQNDKQRGGEESKEETETIKEKNEEKRNEMTQDEQNIVETNQTEEEEIQLEEGANCFIATLIADNLIENNDNTDTDPHHNMNTADTIEPEKTETMADRHCPLTKEQEDFKAGVTLPKLFDPQEKCEANCYLFSECIINYAMKPAFLNAIFFILAIVLFALLLNCFKNIMEAIGTKEEKNLKNQRKTKSILRRI